MVSEDGAVKLQNLFAPGLLMEAIDILGNDRTQLSLLLQLCKGFVRPVWLCMRKQHLVPVEAVKFLRLFHIKGMA